jgi:hypothetical protein
MLKDWARQMFAVGSAAVRNVRERSRLERVIFPLR